MNKKEISIADLFVIVYRRWWLLLLSALIVGGAVGLFSIKTYSPIYKSNVLFYVKAQGADGDSSVNNDINSVNWALKVINSYTNLVHTNSYSDEIKDEYAARFPQDDSLSDYSTSKIKSIISVTSIEDTNLFKITVSAPTQELAYNIAQCVEAITCGFIEEKTGLSNAITVADQCKFPTIPDNSNHLARNTAIGLAVGALLMYLVLFFINFFDTRVKSEEDLLNNYTLPILGTVPIFEAPSNRKKVYKYGD